MKKSWVIITGFIFFLLVAAAPAFALDMEYYTYGGFYPVTQAFSKIALIFSDHNYQGLITIIFVLGILIGALGWIAQSVTRIRIPLVWLVPVIFGGILYVAFFIPKGNIAVYDPVINRSQVIGDMPDAVVFMAGTLNLVERGIVNIIDTASAPGAEYKLTAGGIGFKSLESIKNSYPKDSFASTSMSRFIHDCVGFELVRPGTSLSLDQLRNRSTNFLDDFDNAVNPAVYTVYYDSTHPEGQAVSCTSAWSSLKPIYANPSNYDDAIKRVCSKTYYDPSNTVELNTCKNLIQSTYNFVTGTTATPVHIIQQRMIAEFLYDEFLHADPETKVMRQANSQLATTGLGIGITMNQWMPVIRAIMTAIAIGTIPLLVLFLPTPVMGKALSVVFGFFVFLTTWGVTDAVIHGAAMDYASYMFEDMRQFNMGVYAMAALPDLSIKMFSMFGVIRSAGIMLAGLFSMMLIRFGGSALAHLTTNLMSAARNAGAAGGRLLTPAGNAAAVSEQATAMGLLGPGGFPDMSAAQAGGARRMELMRNSAAFNAANNALADLMRTGQVPAGSTVKDIVQSQANSHMGQGTEFGSRDLSMNDSGSISQMTDHSPAGTASFARKGHGFDLQKANVAGISNMAIAKVNAHQKTIAGSHALGSSHNYAKAWDQNKRDAHSSGIAANFRHSLANNITEGWTRKINEGSSFVNKMGHNDQNAFMKILSGGLGWKKFGVSVGGQGQHRITGTTTDGRSYSFDVSEATAEAFSRDQREVREQAVTRTIQDTQSLGYAASLAERIGATDAYNYLQEARESLNISESQGIDLQTAFVRSTAINRFGDDTPKNVDRTINWLNDMAVNQGVQGQKNLTSMMDQFTSGKGYYADATGRVHDIISNSHQNVGAGHADVTGAVAPAMEEARSHTENISVKPVPADNIQGPTGERIKRQADTRKDNNKMQSEGLKSTAHNKEGTAVTGVKG